MLKEVVYSEAGRRMTFHVSGEIGGITETLGVWKDRALKAPSTELTTTTLRDLLARENAPAFIHFISLDIEGAELEALKAFPFETHRFGALAVEHNYEEPKRSQIGTVLKAHGYRRSHTWEQDGLLRARRPRLRRGTCSPDRDRGAPTAGGQAGWIRPVIFRPDRTAVQRTGGTADRRGASSLTGLRDMSLSRCSGVLLHPTCLPGRFGIGDLGSNAVEFLDFLAAAGQRLWQVLPLGPTGYGDSPYQCLSAFAGNPLLISLDRLIDQGLLTPAEAAHPDRSVGRVGRNRVPLCGRRHRFPRGDRTPASAVAPRARSIRCGRAGRVARPVRSILSHARDVAGGFRPLHGRQGRARPLGLDRVGARHRTARSRRARAVVGTLRP